VTDVYPSREQPMPGVTGALVADAARRLGGTVLYEPSRGALARRVAGQLRRGDVLLALGAGDINHISREVRALLESS